MTIAQIIAYAKRRKSTGESDANLLIDLQTIQNELYIKLKGYNEAFLRYEVDTLTSVAAQLEYDLEADCSHENIFLVNVETGEDTEYYEEYTFAGEKEDISYSNRWQRLTAAKIAITEDGEALTAADRNIKVYYNPTPTAITATTQTPDLKVEYHNLYCYALVMSLCGQSDNPDKELFQMHQGLYMNLIEDVKADLTAKSTATPYLANQKQEAW